MPETTVAATITGPSALPGLSARGYAAIAADDPVQLTQQVGEWGLEFTQLQPGAFQARGCSIDLDGVHLARIAVDRTLLHRGSAPAHCVAVFLSGAGSGSAFAQGQLIEAGQCLTLAEGAELEAITHEHYVSLAIAFDSQACRARLGALFGEESTVGAKARVVAPGAAWIEQMRSRATALCASVEEFPWSLWDAERRAGLADQLLAGMAHFDPSRVVIDATSRSARTSRRMAVRVARDYINSRLSEPLRLAEVCRHANVKIRSLEYGFREVTGLTPVAYIRTLRLNRVRCQLMDRRAEQGRSISEIAMDCGFWHLSQFGKDYRRFFGETPTQTRRRAL